MKNLEAVGTVGLAFQNSVTGLFSWEEQQRNKEKTRETNGDIQVINPLPSQHRPGLKHDTHHLKIFASHH